MVGTPPGARAGSGNGGGSLLGTEHVVRQPLLPAIRSSVPDRDPCPARHAQNHLLYSGELPVLRCVAPSLRHPLVALHRRRFFCRWCHGQSAGAGAPAGAVGGIASLEPGSVGGLQVLGVRCPHGQPAFLVRRPGRGPAGAFAASARRDLVLHVPDAQLHDRHLSGPTDPRALALEIRLLRGVLPAIGGGADRTGARFPSPDRRTPTATGRAHDSRARTGDGGAVQKTGDRRQLRSVRGGRVRKHERIGRSRRVVRHPVLRRPDLLRLQRIHRRRPWDRAHPAQPHSIFVALVTSSASVGKQTIFLLF